MSFEIGRFLIPEEMRKYFEQLELNHGIRLTEGQKVWYTQKAEIQTDNMKREYPSTPDEAFESSNQGYYFVNQLGKARTDNRICHLPPDAYAKKFAAWDIGWDDATAIWIYDIIGKEVHFLDYYENSGEDLSHFIKWVKARSYPIERHFMPHDAANKHPAQGKSYSDYAREAGLKVDIIPRAANELIDIELVRSLFARLFFDKTKCAEGLRAVENFRKEWNEKNGCYRDRPFHNWASHGTKALIYAIHSLQRITGSSGLSAEEWAKIRSRYT